MFSALNQGSTIHVIERDNGLKYKTGEVIGVTQPNGIGSIFPTSYNNPNNLITIKAKVDGEVRTFPEVVPGQTVMSYNNGSLIISETVQGIQTEIDNIYNRDKQIIDNIDFYKKEIEDCENIKKTINPQFAKDKERDDRINGLDFKVTNMESKLDKILSVITNNSSTVKI